MIRVFVGCAANHEDLESQAVLEWSIKKHASKPFEIIWMKQSKDPASPFYGWNTSQWVTPFSGFRWAVPELCGFEGRGIYSDSDVIYMADITKLHDHPFVGKSSVIAKGGSSWRLCVSLWDCAKAKEWMMPLSELKSNYLSHSLMSNAVKVKGRTQPFANKNWNCLDGENYANLNDQKIGAIHYTAIANQPQLKYAIPRLQKAGQEHWYNGKVETHWRRDLIDLFDRMLKEAKDNGYTPERYIDAPAFGPYVKKDLKGYRPGPRR